MRMIQAGQQDVSAIHQIVQTTINQIYPKFYPKDVVRFFLDYHSSDKITKAIGEEYIVLMEKDGQFIGTGALAENEIKRMFILPEFQKKGYGSLLLDSLEHKAAGAGCHSVVLCSSLPAFSLYEKRGYVSTKYEKIVTQRGQVLCFNRMSKLLSAPEYKINYSNRIFTSVWGSKGGEVSDKTVFKYNQQNDIVWAEYSGGGIIRGYLLGITDKEGNLEFCYQHINEQKEYRTGKGKAAPQMTPDKGIRLTEEWEWTNKQWLRRESFGFS